MMNKENKVLQDFILTAENEINSLLENLPIEDLGTAMDLILDSESRGGRIHVTGIGKPGHLSGYFSSLMSSTGTPTYFLHGTEAVHGSCGQLIKGDVVICISNSGETEELKSTVQAVKNNGCKIIGVTGNGRSWLAKHSDVHILAYVNHEGGPLNKAPRMSIIAQTLIMQTLSIMLQDYHDINLNQYQKWHPGGTLGQNK